MIDSEFTTDFTIDDGPALKKASIVGIWKHNQVRRMIIHHKTHRETYNSKKTSEWIEDQYDPKIDRKLK